MSAPGPEADMNDANVECGCGSPAKACGNISQSTRITGASICGRILLRHKVCLVMKSALSFCLIAVGLAACADAAVDSSGWFRYDGTPIKGNAGLEQQFNRAYGLCFSNKNLDRDCMSSRGYTDVPVASSPVIPATSIPISTTSTDWRARAAEARALAAQLQDPASKRMMIGIAETYDRLAVHQDGSTAAEARKPPRP